MNSLLSVSECLLFRSHVFYIIFSSSFRARCTHSTKWLTKWLTEPAIRRRLRGWAPIQRTSCWLSENLFLLLCSILLVSSRLCDRQSSGTCWRHQAQVIVVESWRHWSIRDELFHQSTILPPCRRFHPHRRSTVSVVCCQLPDRRTPLYIIIIIIIIIINCIILQPWLLQASGYDISRTRPNMHENTLCPNWTDAESQIIFKELLLYLNVTFTNMVLFNQQNLQHMFWDTNV